MQPIVVKPTGLQPIYLVMKTLLTITLLSIFTFLYSTTISFGQYKFSQYTVEAGNAVSSMPIVGAPQLFYTNFHPYLTIGARHTWKEKRKHAWEQSVNIGYMYHRFVQHTIPLFTEIIYRYNFSDRFNLNAHLGLGYLHSIPDTERFKLNSNGDYEKITNLGRAQGMFRFAVTAGYDINSRLRATVNYGINGQMPFVKSYVPLLPYNTVQLGIAKQLSK